MADDVGPDVAAGIGSRAISDTIFALSSGAPPAGIAVVRISGPRADAALRMLIGRLPPARQASRVRLLDPRDGKLVDNGLAIRFPGPGSATGEDVVELHLHGGRSVVAATLAALASIPGLRAAVPGEFTRRAFYNGRIDLAEAEGLADLLEAETEAQRRSALALVGGALSRQVEDWQARLLGLAAQLEAVLDFSDEGDVGPGLPELWAEQLHGLAAELEVWHARPAAERLKDGIRIAIAGPPNAGKSSLFNALVGRDAAIISSIPGTTRDLIEAPVAIRGTALVLVDTAGLHDTTDAIEAMGVERARETLGGADLVLWLGDPRETPARSLSVQSKADLDILPNGATLRVSARTGAGLDALIERIMAEAERLLPPEGEVAINRRHRLILATARCHLLEAQSNDCLVAAEGLRLARGELDRITGRAGVEDMLDALFGRFCIGK